jgi:hypothetical protein
MRAVAIARWPNLTTGQALAAFLKTPEGKKAHAVYRNAQRGL